MKRFLLAIVSLVVVAVVVVSCGRAATRQQSAQWTPPPVSGTLTIGTPAPQATGMLVPALKVAPTQEVVLPTIAVPTEAPTVKPAVAAPTAAPTRDPHIVIITERDVLSAVSSGAAAQQGVTLENVGVRFTGDNKMILTAGRVGYGFITADNVTLVGRLVAVDGKLQLQTESITPRGIVTSFIPTLANQAVQQYTSKWYIEDVRTTEGQIELRVR